MTQEKPNQKQPDQANLDQAKRLRQIILKQFRNQSGFAEKFGISRQYVSEIATGKQPLSKQMIEKIGLQCGVNTHWLLTGEGEMYIGKPSDDTSNLEALNQALQRELNALQSVNRLQARLIALYEKQLGIVDTAGDEYKFPEISLFVENPPKPNSIKVSGRGLPSKDFRKDKHTTYFTSSLSGDNKKREIKQLAPFSLVLYPNQQSWV